jgi:hypothetical protein
LPKTESTAMVETLLVVLDAMITGEGEVIQEMTAAGGALTPWNRQAQTRPTEMYLEHLGHRSIVKFLSCQSTESLGNASIISRCGTARCRAARWSSAGSGQVEALQLAQYGIAFASFLAGQRMRPRGGQHLCERLDGEGFHPDKLGALRVPFQIAACCR